MRVTRRSYRRKVILFGVMLFVSIALVSTGFAAWVMSSNATKEPGGNVTVGTVTDNSLELSVALDEGYNRIVFAADKNDTAGRVRYGAEMTGPSDSQVDLNEYESLTIKITGYINSIDFLKQLTVKLDASADVRSQLDAAAAAGYIKLPSEWTTAAVIETSAIKAVESGMVDPFTGAENSKPLKFTYEITLEWGDFFKYNGANGEYNGISCANLEVGKNLNPGYFFDSDDPRNTAMSNAEVKYNLEMMRALICGYSGSMTKVEASSLTELTPEQIAEKYEAANLANDSVVAANKNASPAFKVVVTAESN